MNDHKKILQKKIFFTTTDQFLGVWDLETNNFFGLALPSSSTYVQARWVFQLLDIAA